MKRVMFNALAVVLLTAGLSAPALAQMGGGMMGGGVRGGQGMGSIFGQQPAAPQLPDTAGLADLSGLMRGLADHAMAVSTQLAGGEMDAAAQRAAGAQAKQLAVIADRLAQIVDAGLPPDVESRASMRAMREQLTRMPMGASRPGAK